MKQLGLIAIVFALVPAAWAHNVYPKDGAKWVSFYPIQPSGSDIIHVDHLEGETCLVTADAAELIINTQPLLSITDKSMQPALDVTFQMTTIRPPVNAFGNPPDVWHTETTTVQVSWSATGATDAVHYVQRNSQTANLRESADVFTIGRQPER